MVDILLGLQWGDEGKGKVIDFLAKDYEIVARWGGGPNAGHTVYYKGKPVGLHSVPSGIFNPNTLNVIGPQCVINPVKLSAELEMLYGLDATILERLFISERATVIGPIDRVIDILEEAYKKFLTGKNVGTTGQAIGIAYRERRNRSAMLFGQIVKVGIDASYNAARERAYSTIEFYKQAMKEKFPQTIVFDKQEVALTKEFLEGQERQWIVAVGRLAMKLKVGDTTLLLNKALKAGKRILAEGAQGAMLDIDHGDYPNVTSTNTIASSALASLGLPIHSVNKIIGVCKYYTTRVGNGLPPSDIKDEEIQRKICEAGGEVGTTTGRIRGIGWFDLVQMKYSVMINGVTEIYMLKNDVCPIDTVSIVTSYMVNSEEYTESVPLSLADITKVSEKDFSGWKIKKGEKSISKLPTEFIEYLKFIEDELGVPITHVGTGPKRVDLIQLRKSPTK